MEYGKEYADNPAENGLQDRYSPPSSLLVARGAVANSFNDI